MTDNDLPCSKFNLEELSNLTGISRRTIRFYIQRGLLSPPLGEKRGAFYTEEHLEKLLRIKRLSAKHIPLDEIATYDENNGAKRTTVKIGEINVCSHITLGPGLTLVVDPSQNTMTTDKLRQLARDICRLALNDQQEESLKNEP